MSLQDCAGKDVGKRQGRNRLLVMVLLVVATVATYGQVAGNEFVTLDDYHYIYENPFLKKGLCWENVRHAFGFSTGVSYWHPLTWLSLLLDYELFGLNPTGYHLENLFIHCINVLLLFEFFYRTSSRIWASAMVAALFALHPLNVESVAWAVERKTVLASLFFFIALHAYRAYVRKPSIGRYMSVFTAMALGLMAKSMFVFLPILLMVLDYWPFCRLESCFPYADKRVFHGVLKMAAEKIPLVVLSCLSVAVSLISMEKNPFLQSATPTPIDVRIANVPIFYVKYLIRMIWPSEHAVFYPYPASYDAIHVAAATALLATITVIAFLLVGKRPWLVVGWSWYAIALLPVSGLVQAGMWPGIADRFVYLPGIGFFLIVVWGVGEAAGKIEGFRRFAPVVAVAVIAVFAFLSNRQVAVWRDSISLFTQTLKVVPYGADSHYLLGRAMLLRGDPRDRPKIASLFEDALSINPSHRNARNELGIFYLEEGRPADAIPHLRLAALQRPQDPMVHNNLGTAFLDAEQFDEAVVYLSKAVSLNPDNANAHFNLGLALFKSERFQEAADSFRTAAELDSDPLDARTNLGWTYIMLGKTAEGIGELKAVLARKPDDPVVRGNLGRAFERQGRYDLAVREYSAALAASPNDSELRELLRRAEAKQK